jgi:uncharacterized protein YlxW (UPF0749 family)
MSKQQLKVEKQQLLTKRKKEGNSAEVAKLEAEIRDIDTELLKDNLELNDLKTAEAKAVQDEIVAQNMLKEAQTEKLKLTQENATLQMESLGIMGLLGNGLTSLISLLMAIPTILMTIVTLGGLINKIKEKGLLTEIKTRAAVLKTAMAEKIKAAWGMAGSASAIPYVGWVIAGAIIAALIGAAIATAVQASKDNDEDSTESIAKTREELNKLQADMYNLEQSRQSVHKLATEFENLSDKIIKTDEDMYVENAAYAD